MELFTLVGRFLLDGYEKAKRDINDVTESAESSEVRMSSAFAKIGTAIAGAFAIDKIKDFGVAIVEASATVNAEMSAFEQIMGSYSDTAQTKLNEVADSTGVVSTRLTPYMTSLTAKFKGLGNDIETSTDLAQRGLYLASDASAFWDKSLEDSMSALNSFINGSYEGGEAIGLFANDTQLASYAVSQGIVSQAKDWASLDEATKQATRLEYAENMMALSGATGQASKESGAYANVQANLAEKWRQFKAEIGEPLLENVVIPAMEKLSGVVDTLSVKWEQLQTWVKENKDTIQLMIGIVASLTAGFIAYQATMTTMSIIVSVTKWLDGMTLSQKLLNMAMNANPVGIVIGVLTALGTALVLAYNKSETFRNFVNNLGTTLKNTWNSIVDFFKKLPETFQNILNSTKEKFENFKNSISNIWSSVKSGASSAWNSIKNVVTGLVTTFVSGIKTKFNNFKSSVSNIWKSIKDGIVNAITSLPDKMKSIGSDIVEGLWNGIGNMTDWIVGKVRGFGDSVLSGIKNFFGIHSPSTVFAEIGGFLMKGLGIGIEENEDDVIRTVEDAGEVITEALTEGVEGNEKKKVFKAFDKIFSSMVSTAKSYTDIAMSYISPLFDSFVDLQDSQLEEEANAIQSEIDALSEATDEKIALAEKEHDTQLALLEDQYNQGLLSAQEYADKKKALDSDLSKYKQDQLNAEEEAEKKLAEEKNDILKKQFEAKKKTDKANVLINLATAIMKAYAELGVIGGSIASVALGITSANQIKQIDSQKFTPAFAEGGIVEDATYGLVGEEGREAIVPLERNTEWVGGLARAISPAIVTSSQSNSREVATLREELRDIRIMLSEYLSQILNKNTDIVLNGESLAYALAPSIDTNLGDINRLRARGV